MSAEKGRSLKRWARRLRHWWCLLSNPAPDVTQPEVRFRSRLLAQTLLIAILIAVLSSVISLISAVIFRQQVMEQVILALVTAVEMALVYLISRRRNFETAVVLISAVITSQIAISAVLLSESGSLRVYYFLAVVVMFGALFMPPRQLIAMVIVHLLILAMRQLVLNAIAHTPAGGVITLRAVSHPDGTVCAEVSDNGEGIAPEHLPHIFEPFYRPDRARTTDRGGVGLGLSIVRMIVEAYGGRVIAESTPGKGSRFRLCFRALRKPPSLPEVEHPA